MELGVSGGIGGGLQSLANSTEGGALAGIVLALGFDAGIAAKKEMVALADGAHGVFVGGRKSARPPRHVMEQHPVIVPLRRAFGREQRNQAEPFELWLKVGGDLCTGEFAKGGKNVEMGGEVVDLMGLPTPRPAPEGHGA